MDQVAGPIVASLDQPAGSVLERPDGSSIDRAILGPPDISTDSDIPAGASAPGNGTPGLSSCDIDATDTSPEGIGPVGTGLPGMGPAGVSHFDPARLSVPTAPPPPAWHDRTDHADFDPASLSVPTAPPPPAWLVRRPVRKTSRKFAVIALVGMLLAAVALGFTAVNLALKGFAAGSAGSRTGSAGQLVWPAPATAGGLPLHSPVVNNQGTRRAIAQFRQRFAALLGGSTATYPAALYNEPGRVDLVTGGPAWVMYAGFNEHVGPTGTLAAVNRLMASLAGPSARLRPWAVPTGPAGGIAKCSVAIIGLTQMSVCGWATEKTVGAVMSPTRDTTVSELAVLLGKMRPDLQPG